MAVGQRGDRGLAAGMLLVEAPGRKLPIQSPAENADLPAFEQRCHGDRQRCVLRNFRQKIRLRIQVGHQFAAMPHQEKVHVIAVIVDGVQQPQQAALHPAKLHGLGEDKNGVRYFFRHNTNQTTLSSVPSANTLFLPRGSPYSYHTTI